jgi:heterodisulfide reductase subunit C
MDYKPAQVLRLVLLGQKEAIFSSSAIWLCVGCKTCGTRCPNQIHLAAVFDTLRYMALEEAYKSVPAIYALHRSFLDSIRLWGRMHELTMLLEYKLRSRDLFSDVAIGISLIRKGKISFLPERIWGLAQVRGLYETATDHSSAEVGT